MSDVNTTRPQASPNDGIRAVFSDPWVVTAAALTKISNPAVDMTSVEVDNRDGLLPIRVTIIGKNAAGADVIVGVEVVPVGGNLSEAFSETVKRSSTDLSQTLDRIEMLVLKPDEVTPAVAADVITSWGVRSRFNNK